MVLVTEEWELHRERGERGERWATWGTMAWAAERKPMLQRNGLWVFPERTGLRGWSDAAWAGTGGDCSSVVLRVLKFVR